MRNFYVDETKAKTYLVAAASGSPDQLKVARREINTLVLPGQRSPHMNNEKDSRRRAIADLVVRLSDLGVRATIYDAGRVGTERERRARCLEALVSDVAQYWGASIVLDLDESLLSWDRQHLMENLRATGVSDRISYCHRIRHEEQLLAIPDAIAWCWARGGSWRQRIKPIVAEVRTL